MPASPISSSFTLSVSHGAAASACHMHKRCKRGADGCSGRLAVCTQTGGTSKRNTTEAAQGCQERGGCVPQAPPVMRPQEMPPPAFHGMSALLTDTSHVSLPATSRQLSMVTPASMSRLLQLSHVPLHAVHEAVLTSTVDAPSGWVSGIMLPLLSFPCRPFSD